MWSQTVHSSASRGPRLFLRSVTRTVHLLVTESDCPEVTMTGWQDVKIQLLTNWCLCWDWICGMAWMRVYIYVYEKSFEMCICLWRSLIVLRCDPLLVDGMVRSSYFYFWLHLVNLLRVHYGHDRRETHVPYRRADLVDSATQLRRCVKVEVAFLISPSLTILMVSVDVKKHWTKEEASRVLSTGME